MDSLIGDRYIKLSDFSRLLLEKVLSLIFIALEFDDPVEEHCFCFPLSINLNSTWEGKRIEGLTFKLKHFNKTGQFISFRPPSLEMA